MSDNILIANIEKLHTTDLGVQRIKKKIELLKEAYGL